MSFRIYCNMSFRTWIKSYSELKHNCSSHLRTSSETNPYPKGEHNGAIGPKYASYFKCFYVEVNLHTLVALPHKVRYNFYKIFSPLCARRHKIWPSLLFLMSKQKIDGSIFWPTLRKANFAVSKQKSKNHSFKIMVSWYFLSVASEWWYLILKY